MGLFKKKSEAGPVKQREVWRTCGACNGQGNIEHLKNALKSLEEYTSRRCTLCNGRGEVRA